MNKPTFDDIIDELIQREGGYVDDPVDRGGKTKYGISQNAYPDLDIENLSIEAAKAFYFFDYWRPARADEIAPAIREKYFDMVINHGRRNATKILQTACRRWGADHVVIDGLIGPITIAATKELPLAALVLERAGFYNQIVRSDPFQARFLHGWMNRNFSFLEAV